MEISAKVIHQQGRHQTSVRTGDMGQSLALPAKTNGSGSGINGGELLFLALATCYCNDIFREATERGLEVEAVEVEVFGRFGGKGEPAGDIQYRVAVRADGAQEDLLDLMRYTDTVAEIHNTLRQPNSVTLVECSVV